MGFLNLSPCTFTFAGDTSITSKKQIKAAKKQHEKLKKKAKQAAKRKQKSTICQSI